MSAHTVASRSVGPSIIVVAAHVEEVAECFLGESTGEKCCSLSSTVLKYSSKVLSPTSVQQKLDCLTSGFTLHSANECFILTEIIVN